MTYENLKNLRAFFSALKDIGYRSELTLEQIPPFADDGRTPVDKTQCLKLLRSLLGPTLGLKGENEETDNKLVLKYLSNPNNRKLLLGKFTTEEQAAFKLEELLAIKEPVTTEEVSGQPVGQAVPAGQGLPPAEATTSSPLLGGMGLPAAPSIPTPRIRIKKEIPQAQAERQKLFVANSSGAVVGEKEITPTSVRSISQGPSEFHIADKNGNIVETYSKEPISASPRAETPQQPKLIVTDRYGNIKEPQKPLGTQTLYTQDKSGIIREHSVKPPSRFSGFRSSLRNLGSRAGVFFQRNIGKHLTGDRAMNLLGKAGRTGMDALSGINNLGGGGGNGSSTFGNFGGNGNGRGLRDRFRKGRRRARSFFSNIKKRGRWMLTLTIIVPMVLVGVLVLSNPTATPGQAAPLPTTAPTTRPSTDLSSCKFTRSGNPQPVKSSILLGWISSAASSAGIPPQVLASIAMHENQDFTANADNNHDAIKSNQFCNRAPMFCEKSGQVLHSISGQNDPCTPDEIANGARNAQAVGLMQNIDIYNPGKDLCSITESLSIAAAKLKADGLTSQPTQDQVNKAINAYYNSCTYGSYSYCNEVWQDLQNCKPSGGGPAPPGPIGISLTCPVGNPTVICGTAANPVNSCGHGVPPLYNTKCDPYFYICDTSSAKDTNGWYEKYSSALYYAIDVAGTNEVKMPYINGNESVTWTKEKPDPIPIGGKAEWGYRINFTTTTSQGKKLNLDLTHLSSTGLNSNNSLKSGEILGAYFTGINHLHIGLTVDDKFVEPIQQAKMCI